jgi:hypothetical protein
LNDVISVFDKQAPKSETSSPEIFLLFLLLSLPRLKRKEKKKKKKDIGLLTKYFFKVSLKGSDF